MASLVDHPKPRAMARAAGSVSRSTQVHRAGSQSFWLVLMAFALGHSLPVWGSANSGSEIQVDLGRSQSGLPDGWQSLRRWTLDEAKKLGAVKSLTETWPEGAPAPSDWAGRKSDWKGVLLGDLIQKSLDRLSVDERAQVDLIILHSAQGDARALIPRALLTKFPFLLAWSRGTRPTERWVSIPPKNSRSRLKSESVPLDSFFLDGVARIELASSRDRFRTALLQRRTDPIAVRGEKLFLSSCLGCHESGRAPALGAASRERLTQWSASQFLPTHSKVGGVSVISERDWNSLRSYWDAFRSESLEAAKTAVAPPSS